MKFWIPITCASVLLAWTSAAAALTSYVNIGDYYFSPRNDTVLVGDVVRWINVGGAVHNTTGTGYEYWNSGSMGTGAFYSHQFNFIGTFSYRDGNYPSLMTGNVVVIGATPTPKSSWGSLKRSYRRPAPKVGADKAAKR